jgi:hypothetical protein
MGIPSEGVDALVRSFDKLARNPDNEDHWRPAFA